VSADRQNLVFIRGQISGIQGIVSVGEKIDYDLLDLLAVDAD